MTLAFQAKQMVSFFFCMLVVLRETVNQYKFADHIL